MHIYVGLAAVITLLPTLINASSNIDQVVVELDVKRIDQAKRIAQKYGMRFLAVVSRRMCDK